MDNLKPSSEIEDLKVLQTILKAFGPCNYYTIYKTKYKKPTVILSLISHHSDLGLGFSHRGDLGIQNPADNSISPVILFGSNFSVVLLLIAPPALGEGCPAADWVSLTLV